MSTGFWMHSCCFAVLLATRERAQVFGIIAGWKMGCVNCDADGIHNSRVMNEPLRL